MGRGRLPKPIATPLKTRAKSLSPILSGPSSYCDSESEEDLSKLPTAKRSKLPPPASKKPKFCNLASAKKPAAAQQTHRPPSSPRVPTPPSSPSSDDEPTLPIVSPVTQRREHMTITSTDDDYEDLPHDQKAFVVKPEEVDQWFEPEMADLMDDEGKHLVHVPPHVINNLLGHLRGGTGAVAKLRFEQYSLMDLEEDRREKDDSDEDHEGKRLRAIKKTRSNFFWRVFHMFNLAITLRVKIDSLIPLAEVLREAMDSTRHPNWIKGYKPFQVMGSLCCHGPDTIKLFPRLIESASRLTLGVPLSDSTRRDIANIGPTIFAEVCLLHVYRRDCMDTIMNEWRDGKFRQESTCPQCKTDPWEEFLLTWPTAMHRYGVEYLEDESDGATDDGASTESQCSSDGDPHEYSKIREYRHRNLLPSSRSNKNFGPNGYILEIFDFGQYEIEGDVLEEGKKPCSACGYRQDGQPLAKECRLRMDLERAVRVARHHIKRMPERIDLQAMIFDLKPTQQPNGAS